MKKSEQLKIEMFDIIVNQDSLRQQLQNLEEVKQKRLEMLKEALVEENESSKAGEDNSGAGQKQAGK